MNKGIKMIIFWVINVICFAGMFLLMYNVLNIRNYGIWAGLFAVYGTVSRDVERSICDDEQNIIPPKT